MSTDAAGFAHATDRSVAPPNGAFDAGLRPGPFPDRAASLLPGLLAATRTGLTPAGDDELPIRSHPLAGTGVELAGRHAGGQGDLLRGGKGLSGKGLAAKQPPPALLEIQPAGTLGDEGVLDAGVVGQPGPGRDAGVAGEVVGDHHDGPDRVGSLDSTQEVLVADRVARGCSQGDRLPIADP